MSANSGASGNAATNMVTNPYWITERFGENKHINTYIFLDISLYIKDYNCKLLYQWLYQILELEIIMEFMKLVHTYNWYGRKLIN